MIMDNEMLLTIFTPTYNRGYILTRLYKSLCEQTLSAFEWLIVDDGSTDNTKELVDTWKRESSFTIKYIFQENGGKMRAHNRGVLACTTQLFFCVDSDDYIQTNSVQLIYDTWRLTPEKADISGIIAYRGMVNRDPLISCEFPGDIKMSTFIGIAQSGFSGDTSLIYRTDLLQMYLFPDIVGEKFMPEDFVYDQIDENYKLLVLREPLIMCEYLEDGYTRNFQKLYKENPKNWALYYNQNAKYAVNLKEKIVLVAKYFCFSIMAKDKSLFRNTNFKLLSFFSFPLGVYYFFFRYN